MNVRAPGLLLAAILLLAPPLQLQAQVSQRFEALLGLARVKRDAGDPAASRRHFEQAATLQPLDASQRLEYFWVLADVDPAAAVPLGRDLLTSHPGADDVRERTIAAGVASGNEQAVLAVAQAGAEREAARALWFRRVAESLVRQGRHAEAVAPYDAAQRAPDGKVEDIAGLAMVLEASGQAVRAVESWSRIPVETRREHPGWDESRLRAVVASAPPGEAAREVALWLRDHPDDHGRRETMVDLLTRAGDVDGALAAMQPLMDGPDGPRWVRREVDLVRADGRRDRAIVLLERMTARGRATASDRAALADLLLQTEAFDRAEVVLRQLAVAASDCDDDLFRLIDRLPGHAGTTLLIEQLDAGRCARSPTWQMRGVERANGEGRHSAALHLIEQLPEAERAALQSLEGQLRLWTGDPSGAIAVLSPLLAIDPADMAARDALVDAYRSLGDPTRAWRTAGPIVHADSTTTTRLLGLAELALEADQPQAVGPLLERIPADPSEAAIRAGLEGRARLALGRPAEAIERLSAVAVAELPATAALALVDATFALHGFNAALNVAGQVGVLSTSPDLLARRLMLERLAGAADDARRTSAALAATDPTLALVVDAEVALAQNRPLDALAVLALPAAPDSPRVADLRATALAGSGNLLAASELVRMLRERRPDFTPFALRAAELEWRMRPNPETLAAVVALPGRFPGHRHASITAARALATERRHADVVAVLGDTAEVDRLPLEGRVLLARSLLDSGRVRDALSVVVDADVHGAAAILRAELVARVSGEEAGARMFRSLAASSERSADLFLTWAEQTADAQVRSAILDDGVGFYPEHARLHMELAAARAAAGDHAGSGAAAERAVALDPQAGDAWFLLISQAVSRPATLDLEQVLLRFGTAADRQPSLAIGMAERVASLVRAAHDPLLSHALAWLQQDPSDRALLVSRDLARVRLLAAGERWFEALEAADQAVLAHPETLAALRLRADVLSWAGRHDEGIAAYDDYLVAAPGDVGAERQRARVAGWAGRFADATRLYEALRRSHPDDLVIAAEASAKTAFFEGRWRLAVARYGEWLQLDPDNGEARFEMAEAMRAAGDEDSADDTLAALSPEGGHRLAEAALAREDWRRQPSVAAIVDRRSSNGYQGQRLLDLRRQGAGVDAVLGRAARTSLSAEVSSVLALDGAVERSGYEGNVSAARRFTASSQIDGHLSLWDVSGPGRPAVLGGIGAAWKPLDRWMMSGGFERELLLDNVATIDRGLTATGPFAGAMFESPRASLELRSSWQRLSDDNRRARVSLSATRTLSERLSHIRAIVWGEVLDYRHDADTYFAPRGFVRLDGGLEYTHLFAPPRFRGDRMDQVAFGYLVGTDSRGSLYQHPSIRIAWEVSESVALSVRGDLVRSRNYREHSLLVSLDLIGGAFSR